jgi:transposase-like protein
VFLAYQKVPIQVPRVRNRATNTEVPLATYAQLQTPRAQDVGLFRRLLGGLSCRDDEAVAEAMPEAFGLTKSSVSRRCVRASAKAPQPLHERRHDDAELLVLLLHGKSFADDQVVVALGVTTKGEKRILGLVQTPTENRQVCAGLLRELVERGFKAPVGLLVVLDGAKGLSAAVREVFGDLVPIQRCQWHKREDVVSYLPKTQHALWRRKLQSAYAK